MTYTVIIPLKQTARGKSRLQLPAQLRSALAIAMARDTLAAVTAAEPVESVLVVAEDPVDAVALAGAGVEVLVTSVRGLNEAIAEGARELSDRGWTGPVAVLPGDLPFLTAADLTLALTEAAGVAAVVGDADGTGTTLLVAAGPGALAPRFGPDSYRLHQGIGALPIRIAAGSSLHKDVDTVRDLYLPGELNLLGLHTRAVLAATGDLRERESVQVTVLP